MHVFTLTDGVGANVISLNDGSSVWTSSYRLGVADVGATEAIDRIELLFVGANQTSTIRSIEMMLDRARMRSMTRRGPRIFVTVERVDDDQEWRAELFQGSLTAEGVIDDSYKGMVRATLILQRAPVWEGEEVELPLRNYSLMGGNDNPVIGGVVVPNDPAVGCWVQIDAGTVLGALPAPVRLRLTNESTSEIHLRELRIGVSVNTYTDVINITPVIQAEDTVFSKGTDSPDATTSGGSYWVSDTFTTDEILNQWNMPTGLTEASMGNWWWLVARILSYTASPSLRAEIWDESGLLSLWRGVDVRPRADVSTFEMLDFGPVPVPPGGYDNSSAPVRLTVYGQSEESGLVGLDYFYLFPMDSFRRLEQPSMSIGEDEFVEIDETEQRFYIGGTTGRLPILTAAGSPIQVVPNVAQRIHLLYQNNYSVPITNEVLVQVWYRPRRLTV